MGMESGAIPDAQITASSEHTHNHAAHLARLHFTHVLLGDGWSAHRNDENQWLQIDLGSQNSRVTRVATQGRSDSSEWVTQYKLQYSKDGVTFHCYIERGQITEKVKLHSSGQSEEKRAVQKKILILLSSKKTLKYYKPNVHES